MKRTAMILLVLAAMLWQGFASARLGSSMNVLLDAQHAALHWQGEGHHHHQGDHEGDGDAYHVDDSEESASHLALDQSGVTALHVLQTSSFAALGSGAVLAGGARARPSPFLDGPLRPPRSSD